MKTPFSSPLLVVVALLFFALPSRAQSPDDPPPRPPHGALSSVTAGERNVPPPAPAKQIARQAPGGYLSIGFDQLAGFPFVSPTSQTSPASAKDQKSDVMSQVPDEVKKLDGQKVIISGFMLPIKIEKGLATEFLLLNSPMMCCFGITPATNAWVTVKMPKGVPPIQDVPLPFGGRLHVRAQWEEGWLSSIYQLDGEGLMKPRT